MADEQSRRLAESAVLTAKRHLTPLDAHGTERHVDPQGTVTATRYDDPSSKARLVNGVFRTGSDYRRLAEKAIVQHPGKLADYIASRRDPRTNDPDDRYLMLVVDCDPDDRAFVYERTEGEPLRVTRSHATKVRVVLDYDPDVAGGIRVHTAYPVAPDAQRPVECAPEVYRRLDVYRQIAPASRAAVEYMNSYLHEQHPVTVVEYDMAVGPRYAVTIQDDELATRMRLEFYNPPDSLRRKVTDMYTGEDADKARTVDTQRKYMEAICGALGCYDVPSDPLGAPIQRSRVKKDVMTLERMLSEQAAKPGKRPPKAKPSSPKPDVRPDSDTSSIRNEAAPECGPTYR